ncbi:MAG: tRNA (adenosine(37)-N6)-threonylcarbamoyltransferase complex dimerization subunit type 1 TsaB [Chloroflexota bacterium]
MLLAIDTSTVQLGLALYDGAQVMAELTWTSRARHTEELAPALAGLFTRCGKTMDDVQALGVAIGPGSFTSLRVGLAFAKGLALARRIPLVGVRTLDVTAASVPSADCRLAAVLQAGRGRLAVGWYHRSENGWQAVGPAVMMTAEELERKIRKPTIICGELTADERQLLRRRFKNVSLASPSQCLRRPGVLAEIAWVRWQAGLTDLPASLAPIYLHVAGGPPT